MSITDQRTITDAYRKKLNRSIQWVTGNGEERESPSPGDLYDTNAAYQTFVQQEIKTRLINGDCNHMRGWTDRLCSVNTYRWFFEDYKPRHKGAPSPAQSSEPLEPSDGWRYDGPKGVNLLDD